MKKQVILMALSILLVSCKTIDVEQQKAAELSEENKRLNALLAEERQFRELVEKEEEFTYDVEPVLVPTVTYVVVDENDVNDKLKKEEGPVGKDAVRASMKDSIVSLSEYVGGMSMFDYDENKQYPVFTRKNSMSTIILNNDEQMLEGSVPFMSDSVNWEITGDIWQSDEGDRQLIMVKPTLSGLETNMLIVTNKRLYHFVLYSTKDDYQPMVRFRYPTEPKFITSRTKKHMPLTLKSYYDELDMNLVSFNYSISVPSLQKKIDWIPKVVYDDGSHTYIVLPEIVLQKEMPGIWEGSDEITNYEIHPDFHNLIIINKLVEKVTLRVGKQKVTVKKKKGVPYTFTR